MASVVAVVTEGSAEPGMTAIPAVENWVSFVGQVLTLFH